MLTLNVETLCKKFKNPYYKVAYVFTFITLSSLNILVCDWGFAVSVEQEGQHEKASPLEKARALLDQSNANTKESGQLIFKSSQTRRELKRLQAEKRKSKDEQTRDDLSLKIKQLRKNLKEEQKQGAVLRSQAKDVLRQAEALLQEGIYQKWQPWILNRSYMQAEDDGSIRMAHNVPVRSVHPNMPVPTQNQKTQDQLDEAMSLKIASLTAQKAPKDLDIRSFQLSRKQQYFAHVEVHTPAERAKDADPALVPINKIHEWRLLVTDLKGDAITGANIDIEGHMPGHVHGLPTQPLVTKEISPGIYLVEGVKFQMKGWWVMSFKIKEGGKSNSGDETNSEENSNDIDSVTFNLVL